MRLNVSAWAIRKPIPFILLFLALTMLGLVSFGRIALTRMPDVDEPVVSVSVTQAGAAPAELQTQVTKVVEDAIAGLPGVKHITSSITEGLSSTSVEFRLEVNTDRAVSDVRDAVAKVRGDLPRSIDEPVVSRMDAAGLPILTYGVQAAAMTPADLSWFVDDQIVPAMRGVKGVGNVERIGGVAREIRVTLDPDRLLSLGITAGGINAQLRLTSVDMAGGRADFGGREQSIRTLAASHSLDDLRATVIALPDGRDMRLDELADVVDGFAEPRTFARLDGEPVITFTVSRASGASDTEVAAAVERRVDEIRAARPEMAIQRIDSSVAATVGSYESTMHTLFEGTGLAVLVVFLFLRDWRATVIAAITLPLSILPTFWVMEMLGFTLNAISLLAITLVTGVLVDDSIVEIENITRHVDSGKSPRQAAMEGADEIGLAVIAITGTLIAVFAPVSFMGGIAGRYFVQFGLTIATSVSFSLMVARFVTPLLAANFLRPRGRADVADGTAMRVYAHLVRWSVRHRFLTISLSVGLLIVSLGGGFLLPFGFLPKQDEARTMFAIELAPGARLADTAAAADRVTARIRTLPEVTSVFVDGGRQANTRLASLTVNLTPKNTRARAQREIETAVEAMLADEPDIRGWTLRDGGDHDIALAVAGPDAGVVNETAARLQRDMAEIPHLVSVMSTAPLNQTEVQIHPRMGVAADLGVTTDAIAEAVRVGTIGDVDANLARYVDGDRQVPIRVQLPGTERYEAARLAMLKVPAKNGVAVPLAAVAEIELGQGPSAIMRYDRQVRVAVEANISGSDALGSLIAQAMTTPTATHLPPNVAIRQTGDAEVMGEVFSGFSLAIAAGVMMVYAVLVLLFDSFLQPLTILFSLPLSLGGTVLGLLICHMPISMPVVIGILMLMGLVTKNAIMLVDFAIEEIHRGIDPVVAIVDAGRKRARPIIMTSIAMAAGMVPSALSFGAGGEFRAPMAVAVISGLIASTVLSLVVVPAVFLVMHGAGAQLDGLIARLASGVPNARGRLRPVP